MTPLESRFKDRRRLLESLPAHQAHPLVVQAIADLYGELIELEERVAAGEKPVPSLLKSASR